MKSNKILVIENNPAIRFLLQTTLSNFDTIFCSNIESAKKQIKNASLLLVNEGIDTNFDDVSSDKIITIKKPFDPTSLSKKVNRILNQKNVSKTSKQYLSSKDISKRIFDIIFASTILIISLPIFVLISILIKFSLETSLVSMFFSCIVFTIKNTITNKTRRLKIKINAFLTLQLSHN